MQKQIVLYFTLFTLNIISFSLVGQTTFTSYFPQYTDSTSGQLSKKYIDEHFEGFLNDGDTIKNGSYVSFYFETTDTITSGHYSQNKKNGLFNTYYENGQLKWKRKYIDDIPIGEESFFDINGKLLFKSNYETKKEVVDSETIYKTHSTQFYPNGNKSVIGTLLNGQKNGHEMQLYTGGAIKANTNYDLGVKEGRFEVFSENRKLLQKGTYHKNELEGELLSYYPSGELKNKAQFKNGHPDGEMFDYYKNGVIKREAFYARDTLHGAFKTYYENEALESEGEYKKGKLEGVYKEFNNNNTLHLSRFYVNGLKEGEEKIFDRENNLINHNHYQKDVFHGVCFTYYPSGKPHKKLTFDRGIKTGTHFIYYENETLTEVLITDAKGQKINSKNYNVSGQLEQSVIYDYKPSKTEPEKIDVLKEVVNYYPSEKVASKKLYLNGLKHGKWVFYYENKKKEKEEEYKFNQLSGTQTTYYENGKKETEQEYVGGNLYGTSNSYFPSGKLKETTHYKRSKPDGDYIQYYENKKQVLTGQYKNGHKEGVWITYDEKGNVTSKNTFKRGKLISSQE